MMTLKKTPCLLAASLLAAMGMTLQSAAPARGSFIEVNELANGTSSNVIGFAEEGAPNIAVGQTFTIPTTAVLDTLVLGIAGSTVAVTQPLIVNLYTSDSSDDLVTLLATADIPYSDVPDLGGDVTVDFSSASIGLAAGQIYAFTLHVASPESVSAFDAPYSALLNATSTYTGGDWLISGDAVNYQYFGVPSYTEAFEVTAVPEPASMALLVSGTLLALCRRRRASATPQN